jgi:L-2,4-diaminobutyric acid acetyltransferase
MSFDIILRKPNKNDAKHIYNLVKSTKILDVNSEYLYLLQSTHFKDCCGVAVENEKIIGFVSGYIHPTLNDVFFVWQVAVDENFRGKGIAQRLINEILSRKNMADITKIHTTISPSNKSSQRLFEKLTQNIEGEISSETMFEVSDFNNAHEDEVLYEIKLKKENK